MMCLPLIAIIFQLVNYCLKRYLLILHNDSSMLLIHLSALFQKLMYNLHIRLCLFVLQAYGIDEEPKRYIKISEKISILPWNF